MKILTSFLAGIIIISPWATCAAILSGPITNPANGHKYYLLAQQTWTASEAEAVSLGGHLATVRNAAENQWIYAQFSQFGGVSRGLWIGLNDAAQEGTFVWISGETSTYLNWGAGEPANQTGQDDYVHLFWPGDFRQSRWNDIWNVDNYVGIPINGVVEALLPDIVAVALAWNNATGGVDARYRVNNGALAIATTAKLFWANGTSTANILSPTPIHTEPIPVGTGGPGSSGVITFNAPASSFGTPPAGTTHVLLVLDYDNQVQESDENNNSSAIDNICLPGTQFANVLLPEILLDIPL